MWPYTTHTLQIWDVPGTFADPTPPGHPNFELLFPRQKDSPISPIELQDTHNHHSHTPPPLHQIWDMPDTFDPERWERPRTNPEIKGWAGYNPVRECSCCCFCRHCCLWRIFFLFCFALFLLLYFIIVLIGQTTTSRDGLGITRYVFNLSPLALVISLSFSLSLPPPPLYGFFFIKPVLLLTILTFMIVL
ncbi:hypothetical protein T492DRAFT_420677 [Pavlovales sp. CCMP2436]|nr:hypothetical protein T492DRAFT_420677 [Pavlovales sp. CCMP2436]